MEFERRAVGVNLNKAECQTLFDALKLIKKIKVNEETVEVRQFKDTLDKLNKAENGLQEVCCHYNVSITLGKDYDEEED